MNDHINKGNMLGKTGIAKAIGGFKPNYIRLQEPLEGPESVMYSFCTGCGNILEQTQKGVELLSADIDQQLPDNLSDVFFQTASCSCCDGTNKAVSIVEINLRG